MRLDSTSPQAPDSVFTEAGFRRQALHEFGHAIGFDHEVNRDDRKPQPNGGCNNTYDIIPGGTKVSDYDVRSIMDWSYCDNALGDLTPWDIVGVQKVYGRKHSGALVGIGGRCVNIPNADPTVGSLLQIFDCSNAANDTWRRSANDNLNATLSGSTVRSINVPGGFVPAVLTSWSDVETSVNEHFKFTSVSIRGLGENCLTASSPFGNGSLLSMATCNGSTTQKWDWEKVPSAPASRNDRFRLNGSNLCINVPNGTVVEGQTLQLYQCGTPFFDNEMFSATRKGEIKTLANPALKCLTVTPDNVSSGNAVVSSSCSSVTAAKRNQQFSIRMGAIRWAGNSGVCLDVADGVSVNGALVQSHSCVPGAPNEFWDYYF